MFKGKTLLVTGGTGSFGNAAVKRFLNTGVDEIRILSRDEKKQDDMRRKHKSDRLKFYLGDVRDYGGIEHAFRGVDLIFHAAALKQVPSCEFFPLEAFKTNVLGTENVLNAAINMCVKKVICLSTDKAVHPVNAMGISKAMMEKLVTAKSRYSDSNSTLMCTVRYGNVMNTRGSVIPLFISQIKKGSPLTVTDGEMTRFMITLDEAVELVASAFEYAENGDIFVSKAPACSINTLAQAVCELFGTELNTESIGVRHGEKINEMLLTSEELMHAEDMGAYFRIPCDSRDLNYGKYFESGSTNSKRFSGFTSDSTKNLSVSEVKDMLLNIEEIKEEVLKYKGD